MPLAVVSASLALFCLIHPLSGIQTADLSQGRSIAAVVASQQTQPILEPVSILRTQLNDLFAAYPNDTISVSLASTATNTPYDFGSSEVMRGASTTKIITALDYLHQVELGNASLDQLIDGETAQDLLQAMVQESDPATSNDAWYDFLDYLSYDQVTEYGESIGLTSFNAFYNTLTAHDEAVVLQKMYDGTLVNQAHAALLYSFMQSSADEGLIPAALPAGAQVYDKYGELYGFLHDAAIITYKGHSFVLVIYTNNASGTLDDYTARVQLFHAITKEVLNYELS
jgi:beta-lactamase class A